MKIPQHVRIAGVDYAVEMREHLNDQENVLRGQILYNDSLILLNPCNHGHQALSQTLLHEVLHGIFYHYGIQLEEKEEEVVVDRLAHGLYQVLQDNARKLYDLAKESTT